MHRVLLLFFFSRRRFPMQSDLLIIRDTCVRSFIEQNPSRDHSFLSLSYRIDEEQTKFDESSMN